MKIKGNKNISRKSICFLTDILIIGGMENVLIEALKVLHTKYDIQIISLYCKPSREILDKIPADVKVIDKQIPNKKTSRLFSNIPYLSKFYFNKVIGSERFDYLIALKRGEMYASFCN